MKTVSIVKREQLVEPKEGDVLSWDKQPEVINRVQPARKGRTFARVAETSREGYTSYSRLSFVRSGDWQEFTTETVKHQLERGTMELHDKPELIGLIRDSYKHLAEDSKEWQEVIEAFDLMINRIRELEHGSTTSGIGRGRDSPEEEN